jgi:glycosyltransferase involved in cell wall biosynthesis
VHRGRVVIVFAVPDFDPAVGGTTRQTRLQATEFQRRGDEVLIVTRRMSKLWPEYETIDGLDVVRIGPPGRDRVAALRALAALGRSLASRRRDVEVLQIVMWPDAIFAAARARLVARTVVLWAIDGEITQMLSSGPSVMQHARSLARRAWLDKAAHVTLTPRMASEFDTIDFRPANTVIPVPVDRRHFRPPTPGEREAARSAAGISADTFVVVYVGHLQVRKAVDRLIAAIGELRNARPNVRLLVVGGARGASDDTDAQLRREAVERGLEDVVTFCGVAPDPRPYLWAADVLALPSNREGMPNSLLEALACGLPCVAPASAGGNEVLDNETGIVPSSNDPLALFAALRELASDETKRRRMGETARRRSERYDVELVVDEYQRLYAQLGKRPRRR